MMAKKEKISAEFVEIDLIMDKISNADSKSDHPFRFSVGKYRAKYNNTPLTRA